MFKLHQQIHYDEQGSVFIETALLIIGIAFAVAPFMFSLGDTLGGKVQNIQYEVEQVGM